MKIAVLNKFKTEESSSIVIDNRNEYCNLYNYEFINDISIIENNHWKEENWAHIPVIINILKTRSDIDWLLYVCPEVLFFDMDISIESIIGSAEDKKFIIGSIELSKKLILQLLPDKIIVTTTPLFFTKKMLLNRRFLLIKNCRATKNWLSLIYNDKRFNEGDFIEINKKIENFYGLGHIVIDQAFTLYFEYFPEFRNLIAEIKLNSDGDMVDTKNPIALKMIKTWIKLFPEKSLESFFNYTDKKPFFKNLPCDAPLNSYSE